MAATSTWTVCHFDHRRPAYRMHAHGPGLTGQAHCADNLHAEI